MPHLPVIADVFRVAIVHGTADNKRSVNVINVRTTSGRTPSQVAHDLDLSVTTLHPFIALHSAYNIDHVKLQVTKLDGVSPTIEATPTDPAWGGGTGGDAVPEAALGMTIRTAKRGRSFRGRLFIGPVSESEINDGLFTGTQPADTSAAWSAWATAFNATGSAGEFGVASYKLAQFNPVTEFETHLGVRTQRPRLVRVR